MDEGEGNGNRTQVEQTEHPTVSKGNDDSEEMALHHIGWDRKSF